MGNKAYESLVLTSTPQPCFRCADENNSVYDEVEGACISCNGTGSVTPGPCDGEDLKMIKRYTYTQWWVRLRELKAEGMKLGKKKERDKRIKRQSLELFEDFKRMGRSEQRTLRMAMSGAIAEFETLKREKCAS